MPEGNKSRVSGDGLESNRPIANFLGFSMGSNKVDLLVEKIGLASIIRKSYQTRLIPV